MNLSQSRLVFRYRSAAEAADLGRRLIASELGYYVSLYAVLCLPILLIACFLFWGNPFWLIFWLWWLKPLPEYGILSALSIQAFGPLPPWRHALKQGFKLMFQKHVFGDLTIRRFNPTRSFNMPIRQLEHLTGKPYRQRCRELGRYGNTSASNITLTGNLLEAVWTNGLLLLAYWFLYGNFIEQALVQPSHMQEIDHLIKTWYQSWVDQQTNGFLNYVGLAYFAAICFWAPFYVASGFTLYLGARVQTEAWDIRLVWQQLGQRKRGEIHRYFSLLVCALFLNFGLGNEVHAEPLPNAKEVNENRKQVLEQPPYFHVGQEDEWCWLSCEDSAHTPPNPIDFNPTHTNSGLAVSLMQLMGYTLLIALIIGILYALFKWWQNHGHQWHNQTDNTVPTSLFGLDMRRDSLPKNVSQHALSLLQTDPRAALSLLYRASLSQLVNQRQLPIKEHHTEGQVLELVEHHAAALNPFFQPLTQAWLHTAYGHEMWSIPELQKLCQQYAQYFEVRKIP